MGRHRTSRGQSLARNGFVDPDQWEALASKLNSILMTDEEQERSMVALEVLDSRINAMLDRVPEHYLNEIIYPLVTIYANVKRIEFDDENPRDAVAKVGRVLSSRVDAALADPVGGGRGLLSELTSRRGLRVPPGTRSYYQFDETEFLRALTEAFKIGPLEQTGFHLSTLLDQWMNESEEATSSIQRFFAPTSFKRFLDAAPETSEQAFARISALVESASRARSEALRLVDGVIGTQRIEANRSRRRSIRRR